MNNKHCRVGLNKLDSLVPSENWHYYKYLYEATCKERDSCMKRYIALAKTATATIERIEALCNELKKQNEQLAKNVAMYEKQLNLF